MPHPVQYMTYKGWKDLMIMDEIITDMSKAIEMVRASTRANIKLQQMSDVGVGKYEWNNF